MGLKHVFGDRPIPKVLDFLLAHRHWDYPLSAIEEATGISYRTLQVVVPDLVKSRMIRETREVGKAKMYAINYDSLLVQKLHAFSIQADLEAAQQEAIIATKIPAVRKRN
ncbi:hypothetical protein HY989_02590 [Candidatus Micrarchaeota archaeon]|nr:hypothetical protein [Candidatus Micrarchaeota archaeon]